MKHLFHPRETAFLCGALFNPDDGEEVEYADFYPDVDGCEECEFVLWVERCEKEYA